MTGIWKENWEETKQRFIDWWQGRGLLIGGWGGGGAPIDRLGMTKPEPPATTDESFLDTTMRVERNHYAMSRTRFPLETLPKPDTTFGPGTLATFLGSEPQITPETVWYETTIEDVTNPESLPPLIFDPENKWFKHMAEFLENSVKRAEGRYLIPMPDLIENVDILANLRDNQVLMMDMIMRPDWVSQKLEEINQVYFEAFDALYDIIRQPEGGNVFCAFSIWGPGKTAKVQCDASAMFSPAMFKQFVVPTLSAQCEWLDNSMFHLDGHQCIPHLDHLLEIEALDAIEWTPDPCVPGGGDPEWYPMYKRILEAGKSVQAIGVSHDQIKPLLDAVGPDGMYVMTNIGSEEAVEKVSTIIEPYR